jgi:hypothetical protein
MPPRHKPSGDGRTPECLAGQSRVVTEGPRYASRVCTGRRRQDAGISWDMNRVLTQEHAMSRGDNLRGGGRTLKCLAGMSQGLSLGPRDVLQVGARGNRRTTVFAVQMRFRLRWARALYPQLPWHAAYRRRRRRFAPSREVTRHYVRLLFSGLCAVD